MIKLSDHFTYEKIFRFTLPAIGMVVVMSVYSIIDGFFVSNFVGTFHFAALNFVMPMLTFLSSVGILIGTGGSALIAKTLGEGKRNKANQIFSMLVYFSIAFGILLAIFGINYIDDWIEFLGAKDDLLELSTSYGQIVLLALPLNILQFEFMLFSTTAEKPHLGFYVILATGITNVILDALFIIAFGWGLEGAAIATAISQAISGIVPLIYFGRKNTSLLRLTKTTFDVLALVQTCMNGISELLAEASVSIVSMLYNWQLLRYAGSDGVAAFGILMYATFIFESMYIGYSLGIGPVISYHYGAKNYTELKSLLKKSGALLLTMSIIMFTCAEVFARPVTMLFIESDKELLEMTVHAFRIFSFAFLFMGFGIFTSAFFTALNNGLISAIISGLRTLVFEVIAVLTFPLIFGLEGIWFSMVGADIMALTVSAILLRSFRKRYHYY